MKRMIWMSLLFSSVLFAGLKVGDPFPELTLEDQFKQTHTISKKDRWVLMSFEKDVAVQLSKYVKQKQSDYVVKHRLKIVSDISSMPTFITKMFALPKMKKYPFPVMLIYDDEGKKFDKEKGKVTVYELKNGKVVSIHFATPEMLEEIVTR